MYNQTKSDMLAIRDVTINAIQHDIAFNITYALRTQLQELRYGDRVVQHLFGRTANPILAELSMRLTR